jgi:hypothetical protein
MNVILLFLDLSNFPSIGLLAALPVMELACGVAWLLCLQLMLRKRKDSDS